MTTTYVSFDATNGLAGTAAIGSLNIASGDPVISYVVGTRAFVFRVEL